MLFGKKDQGITKEKVLEALGHVDDPDLKKDLVTLGMIEDLEINGKKVSFTVMLTTPACPIKDAIQNACINAVKLMVDQEADVTVNMSARVTSTRSNEVLPAVKNVIAISSGKGGVGKSTVAANLAVALQKTGAKVGLVDADIYGPSIPMLFGFQDDKPRVEQMDGRDMLIPFERHGIKLMSIGVLVRPDQAVVWRGPMASKALKQLIFDTNWGDIDYLLVDLPPGTGDVHLTLVQALPVTGAVVVTTPQELAVADARKGAEMFRNPQIDVPVLGVIENMAYFIPDDAPEKKYYLFGKGGGESLANAIGAPLLGQIPLREGMAANHESGQPEIVQQDDMLRASFGHLAKALAQHVAVRNARLPATSAVKITTG